MKVTVSLISILFIGCNQNNKVVTTPNTCYDENSAIQAALSAWIPAYGTENIEKEKPYKANLNGNIWTVTGTLPANEFGGFAFAKIQKNDCKIIEISHEK